MNLLMVKKITLGFLVLHVVCQTILCVLNLCSMINIVYQLLTKDCQKYQLSTPMVVSVTECDTNKYSCYLQLVSTYFPIKFKLIHLS